MSQTINQTNQANEQVVVWVHGDCLSPLHPALQKHPGAPAIWVWDDALLEEWQLGLKRLTFLYECLLELPVIIRRGNVAAEVARFAQEHQAQRIVTTESPSPRFRELQRQLTRTVPVEILPLEPFVAHQGPFDLRRFARYWRVAEPYAYGAKEQMKLW